MALYTIGDLHLSLGSDKTMEVFGESWRDYVERISDAFSQLNDDDVTVLCGDLSWGMSLEESLADFRFIDALPGRKILMKGNHDYWWNTAAKISAFFRENGITTLKMLHNNCHFYGETAICGTRGWFFEEEKGGEHDKKVMAREIMRLETSLKAAGEREKLCFLHYPPIYGNGYVCREIIDLFEKYGVKRCFYGHIHGPGHRFAVNGERFGTQFHLVSADYLGFRPLKIM